jgi:hypothetical protein
MATLKLAVTVWHVKKDLKAPNGRSMLSEIGWGDEPIDFPRNHEQVAEFSGEVETDALLNTAYRLTQNAFQSWSITPADGLRVYSRGARSTHIGDVIVVGGVPYVVAPVGFVPYTSPEQKLERRI